MDRRSQNATEQSRKPRSPRTPRRFRFELSWMQLLTTGLSALVILIWMFGFGVFVGRDLPINDATDPSIKTHFLRFLGIARELKKPAENAADTWEQPEKMLEELDYYNALTKKAEPSKVSTPAKTDAKSDSASVKVAEKPSSSGVNQDTGKSDRQASEKKDDSAAPIGLPGTERYFLMVSSVRNVENAQNLVDQLRAKGYEASLETVDMTDSGRWHRILVGPFNERQQAQRFAAEFNKRENMQGLVIRSGN